MRPGYQLSQSLLRQRGHLFGWVPVTIGAGIGLYFSARIEPDWLDLLALTVLMGLSIALVRPLGSALGPLALGLALILAGYGMAAMRAQQVAAPVLGFRYYGAIEGRIVAIDRSSSDALRLTLDQVRLERVAPGARPERVRISLYGAQDWLDPVPGLRVMTTGHLSPPNGPAEPGDFDFRRKAWFDRIGAVGYTRNPVLVAAPASDGQKGLAVDRLRTHLATAVRARIPGDAGGYAAAVMTGDRSGLSEAANEAMRASNLYHLVSISGMHMGMLAAFVFALVQGIVAAIPPLALRVPAKKVAALVALPVAAFYLALAGRDIPTERAFVTVAVMLGAVLMDRQALTLRSVAIAALIVMVLRPESLVNPGFQMSFAAVIALVFAWSLLPAPDRDVPIWRRLALPVLALVFSSLVAGSATAPYAAAHFNRIAHYGVLANLLAVPAMGIFVMPGGVILAVLGPLGLEQPALWMIEGGSRWILFVADRIAALDGAMSAVPRPPPLVLPMITLGGLWLVLWQGRGKVLAALPAALVVVLWAGVERPAVLVAQSGGLVGILTEEGRLLSRPRGDGFTAGVWLENDGQLISQERAAQEAETAWSGRIARFDVEGTRIVQVRGKTALEALDGCGGAEILVTNVALDGPRPCDAYDPIRLRDTGSLALYPSDDGGLRILTVRDISGDRLWHPDAGQAPGLLRAMMNRPDRTDDPIRQASAGIQ
ncbi:ComEC/Rec2 family competence protein [Ponticoccus sp. SC2-23]|uniref:ComEC/Rec2 family competence protein n=1 Tax=Alexandriicola marinus TaxID=2081710 RepID=UPI000FD84A03|nr:ComEC/Rec2 family competence protein [Alexandriicola marinus]MBM1219242.1 ComEC/Rec2 family competence protein [Ponticoccus sp. SC6-9]MBM1223686.1 ComEC/Rec2 family competence protein [Ponticoccus sp. SC6-15]MBM1229055.1 ComEC/Rec2 family competence protein [Ponticoccus sp. SC6-38]MBM1232652.1 ComEC/Rec2 family competence protein [Ponticoccus sp. SC6-45]MBM1237398.1 ComEC/Rec2 family competence protein [Ponticoccus sp. SC6-49]MBM1241663.1 ComEC/Rec2 family competence protein [Ponticoccus s